MDADVGKSAENERAKLTAVFLNNIGVAFVGASFVGPIFSDHLSASEELAYAAVGIAAGVCAHGLAALSCGESGTKAHTSVPASYRGRCTTINEA
jgi:putative effector of murein hydrolase